MPPEICVPTTLINGDDGKFNESLLGSNTQGGGASTAVVAIMGLQSSGIIFIYVFAFLPFFGFLVSHAYIRFAKPYTIEREMHATEFINGEDGKFNESLLEDSTQGGGASIAVVAIMGPQSSGKSTLLNQLFGTNFEMMNARNRRGQTTKGIWIAKAPHTEPVTMVLDLEGTDGKERGEDKTFEKQSALFALAVADTVIINTSYNDIGREHAANRPLLRTIFEAMLSFLTPQIKTLIFVVRDKPTETPTELLELELKKDAHKIWEAVPKPKGHEHTPFTQIFNMEVTALSHYEHRRAEFDREVKKLKLEIISSHKKRDNIDQNTFLSGAKDIWDKIKENKELEVPPLRVMVATIRCEEIVSRQLGLLQSKDQPWPELQRNAKNGLVKDFGQRTSSILKDCLSKYDAESMNLEENVAMKKRQFLMSEALKVVHPAYMHTLHHIRSAALRSYEDKIQVKKIVSVLLTPESKIQECCDSCVRQFTQQCSDYAAIKQANWEDDVSTVRQQLLQEIETKKQKRRETEKKFGTSAVSTVASVGCAIVTCDPTDLIMTGFEHAKDLLNSGVISTCLEHAKDELKI